MRPRVAATLALIPATIFIWYVATVSVVSATLRLFSAQPPVPIWAQWVWALLMLPGPFPYYYISVLALWWGTVRWTTRRRVWVAIITAALLCATVLGGLAYAADTDIGILILGAVNCIFGPGCLVLIAWLCYPREVEREVGSVLCPRCGYDMRGQRSCRCPECGAQFSLGELVEPPEKRAASIDGG